MIQQYRIYHNPDSGFWRRYEHGDRLIEGHFGEITAEEDDAATLEAIFARHNYDDRPDGGQAPSLSVGDIVVLVQPGGGDDLVYTVESIGFARVHEFAPIHVLDGPWSQAIKQVHPGIA